jgi:hypothetical protein
MVMEKSSVKALLVTTATELLAPDVEGLQTSDLRE